MDTLILGLSLGLAAGLAPGPLHALIITSTLQRGLGAGLRIAVAPLITDTPIVVLSVLTVGNLPDGIVRGLAIIGGIYIAYLGIDGLRRRGDEQGATQAPSRDMWRGAVTNMLNPHPWLFWLGVGGPILTTAWADSVLAAFGFLFGFYLLLIGSKAVFAVAVSRGRRFADSVAYRAVEILSALALIGLGIWLIMQGAGGTL